VRSARGRRTVLPVGDSSLSARLGRHRVAVHHVIWAVSAVGFVVAAWTSATSTSAAPFLAPFVVATAWSASGVGWTLVAGRVVRSKEPRGKPHPRSRRARGLPGRTRSVPPPWGWPLVLAYALPVLLAPAAGPFVLEAQEPRVVLLIQPFALVVGGLSGVCVALLGLFVWICVRGVAGFGRPLVTGRVDGERVDRAPLVGPFVATTSLLAVPVVLAGPFAYDSPYRRDVLPLLGILREGVDVTHPVLLAVSQVATWTVVLGVGGGWLAHRRSRGRVSTTEEQGRPTPTGVVHDRPLASVDGMTDEVEQAAIEAAQRVVDEVSSWQYSAEDAVIAEQLDEGLAKARVSLSDDERTRILAEIDGMKDEQSAAPQVRSAAPAE
jgi:hypothetical protein